MTEERVNCEMAKSTSFVIWTNPQAAKNLFYCETKSTQYLNYIVTTSVTRLESEGAVCMAVPAMVTPVTVASEL